VCFNLFDFDIGYLKSRNKTQYDSFGGTPTDKLGDRKLNKITINANNKFSIFNNFQPVCKNSRKCYFWDTCS
jgi:hypothetical protein